MVGGAVLVAPVLVGAVLGDPAPNEVALVSQSLSFIDSVDEAKLRGVRLLTALRKLAAATIGVESRTYVVLSGRYTDWEFTADLDRLNEELPIPKDQSAPSPPPPDELIIRTIRHERASEDKKTPHEAPIIVIMLGLDAERVPTGRGRRTGQLAGRGQ